MSRMTEFRQALRAQEWDRAERSVVQAPELVHRVDGKGRSLIEYAAKDGRWAEVRWLLRHAACVDHMVSGCFMSLDSSPPDDIVLLMEERLQSPELKLDDWGAKLGLAAQAKNIRLCRLLIERPERLNGAGWQACWFACMKNFDASVADVLLAGGGGESMSDCRGLLASSCVTWRSGEGLAWLARRGLDVNDLIQGELLLGLAAKTRFISGIDLLLHLGAMVDGKDGRGHSALYHCVAKGHEAEARMLLSAGADPELRQGRKAQGDSPLRLAAKDGSHGIRKLLMPEMESVALGKSMPVRLADGRLAARL